jgi:hypothetical protein
MGRIIGEGVKDYMDLMYDEEMNKQERRQKLNELKSNKLKRKQKLKAEKSQNKTGNIHARVFSLSSPQRQMNDKI